MKSKLLQFFSWLGLTIGFAFVLMVNTSEINTGGQFIDFERWQTLTYWTQLVANTLFLVMVYSTFLYRRKDELMNDNEQLEDEYKKLFAYKDTIINQKKKNEFEYYIKLIINLIERLEAFRYKLNINIKRWDKMPTRAKYTRIRAYSEQIESVDKYIAALMDAKVDVIQKSELDINAMNVKVEEINFDVIFNTVDYETNKPISVSYSDTREARRMVRKSPLSAFTTMFLSILAFGNILVANDDLRSTLLIMLAVAFGAMYKVQEAYKHAEKISKNKRRALKKTNDMIAVFLTYDINKLDAVKNAVYHIEEVVEEVVEEIAEIPSTVILPTV